MVKARIVKPNFKDYIGNCPFQQTKSIAQLQVKIMPSQDALLTNHIFPLPWRYDFKILYNPLNSDLKYPKCFQIDMDIDSVLCKIQ